MDWGRWKQKHNRSELGKSGFDLDGNRFIGPSPDGTFLVAWTMTVSPSPTVMALSEGYPLGTCSIYSIYPLISKGL